MSIFRKMTEFMRGLRRKYFGKLRYRDVMMVFAILMLARAALLLAIAVWSMFAV